MVSLQVSIIKMKILDNDVFFLLLIFFKYQIINLKKIERSRCNARCRTSYETRPTFVTNPTYSL